MDQKIGYKEHRVFLILANIDLHRSAILFHHHTVKCKGQRYPLILLHASVIVGVEIGEAPLLIQRVLLHIKPRGINMSPKDIHPLRHRFLTDAEQNYGLVHPDRIDLITLFQAAALLPHGLQFPVACFFSGIDNAVYTFPLCLSLIQKLSVFIRKCIYFLQLFTAIGFPCIFLFHDSDLHCQLLNSTP